MLLPTREVQATTDYGPFFFEKRPMTLSTPLRDVARYSLRSDQNVYGKFVDKFAKKISERHGDAYFFMGYAVGEAIENIMEHGHHWDPNKNVEVHWWNTPEAECFHITGTGTFNPHATLARDLPTEPDTMRTRGRGMILMRELSDFFLVDEEGQGYTLYFLRRRLPS